MMPSCVVGALVEMMRLSVEIRPYAVADLPALCSLFYQTVHAVNARDYSPEQLQVWAPELPDLRRWNASLLAHRSYVAVYEGCLVGFGDISPEGYLDRLYVHKDYQGRGVGSALCDVLESCVSAGCLTVHASLTARGFFERRGYELVCEREVVLRGVSLRNFLMRRCREGQG